MTGLLGDWPEWCAVAIELLGIGIITVIAVYSLLHGIIRLIKGDSPPSITVAVELTFSTVGVLALVVLIRTFLSFTLEVELTGKWPWQLARSETAE